jgi:hypothetical protein
VSRFSERLAAWRASVASFLKSSIGSVAWSPPPWVASLREKENALRARAAANPRLFRRNALLVALGLVGLWTGVVLWRNRPRGVRIDFSVAAPPATNLTVDNPKPEPLRVHFETSVAPLETVGKVITTGVDISPEIVGTWRWVGDRDLQFLPENDWPVGKRFSVSFNGKGFVAPSVKLENYGFDFVTAPFVATLTSAEFYQDPTQPQVKQVLVKFTFTHPVDTASLRSNTALKIEGPSGGFLQGLRSIPFTVSVDKKGISGSILSS